MKVFHALFLAALALSSASGATIQVTAADSEQSSSNTTADSDVSSTNATSSTLQISSLASSAALDVEVPTDFLLTDETDADKTVDTPTSDASLDSSTMGDEPTVGEEDTGPTGNSGGAIAPRTEPALSGSSDTMPFVQASMGSVVSIVIAVGAYFL